MRFANNRSVLERGGQDCGCSVRQTFDNCDEHRVLTITDFSIGRMACTGVLVSTSRANRSRAQNSKRKDISWMNMSASGLTDYTGVRSSSSHSQTLMTQMICNVAVLCRHQSSRQPAASVYRTQECDFMRHVHGSFNVVGLTIRSLRTHSRAAFEQHHPWRLKARDCSI